MVIQWGVGPRDSLWIVRHTDKLRFNVLDDIRQCQQGVFSDEGTFLPTNLYCIYDKAEGIPSCFHPSEQG